MEKPSCINKYFFSTGFRNAVLWTDRLVLLTNWRLMAKEYPHLNLTIYEDFSMYSDQVKIYICIRILMQHLFFSYVLYPQ